MENDNIIKQSNPFELLIQNGACAVHYNSQFAYKKKEAAKYIWLIPLIRCVSVHSP